MKLTNQTTRQEAVKELGERIKKYRLNMNLKQTELAGKSGVSIATIRRLEAGEDVSMRNFISALLALGLASNLNYLLPDEIVNPVNLSAMGHARERAVTKKNTEKLIKWGD